jgi:hypothetical protein
MERKFERVELLSSKCENVYLVHFGYFGMK